MKQIYRIIVLLFFTINLNAQNTEAIKKDSLKNKSIELFRKVFWDNLPKPVSWTNDYENLYSDAEQTKLDSVITEFESETTFKIGIVTIDTLKTSKENFEKLSLHIAQTWGVGNKDKDNGILITISKGYRKIRIEHGNGIEKIITEDDTKTIIDNYFIPAFRKEQYFNGTLNGLIEIIKLLKNKTEK
jgi:uncharacterized protein